MRITIGKIQTSFDRIFLALYLLILPIPASCLGENSFKNTIVWEEVPGIPPGIGEVVQPGLASPFAGYSNGAILVAGGSNFPEDPVNEGGIKKYYDDIFIYDMISGSWSQGPDFPVCVAYGTSVTTPFGIVCIGGNNAIQSFSQVHLLQWDKARGTVEIQRWPDLPFRMANMGAALAGNIIYVAGGSADDQLANKFVSLDLSRINTTDFNWEVLPDFPGPARIQPVGVAQNAAEEAHFYLFSGSSFPETDSLPTITTDGLEYDPTTGSWSRISNIVAGDRLFTLHGASGTAIGSHHILFIGGVNREIFSTGWLLEKKLQKAIISNDSILIASCRKALQHYLTHPPEWYKFNRDILVYHTITDSWFIAGEYPFPGPAGAPLVKVADDLYMISGEIKPGLRSPRVYLGRHRSSQEFGAINWTMLTLYLAGMLFLGYYFMKKENTTLDFFKGGERIPWWAAGMSIFATMLSAITFMAIPSKTYTTDWRYFIMAITILVVAFPVVRYYLPFFRRLKITTAYEYLEVRFNTGTRLLASGIFIVFMVARTALVLFLPSLALTTVTGIDIYACIILMGVITIMYCTMGGIEAVIWGDVIQGFVLMGGALLALFFLVSGMEGGVSELIDITIEHEKLNILDLTLSLTSATFWVVLLGGLANNLISYTSDQTVIQRYLTTRDESSAAKSILMNGILSILVSVVFYSIGTALYAYYKINPDQLNISMANPDSIFPHFIMTRMPQGLAGILIAAIFAATMSTVSSSINSLSTAFTTDFYRKFVAGREERHYLYIARWSGIIMGGLGVGLALLMATWNILSLFDYFNYILGLLASGLGGLFLMGIFIPRIKGRAAIIGFLGGFITVMTVNMMGNIHFMIFGFIGMSSSVLIGLAASLVFPEWKKLADGLTIQTLNPDK